jgi:uncharacterized membrane protein YraQ (UPF0718 family)/copper chaperone CopZ
MELVKEYFIAIIGLLNEMSPYLLLGFFFAGLLHVLIPNEKVTKYLGQTNLKSVVNASILGVPLPLCSCGVIPAGISFYKNGASKGSTVSFLISTPQTGVDSIFVTYSMLGLPFAILRPIVAFFSGILGGHITNKITNNESTKNQAVFIKKTESSKKPFIEIFRYAFVDFIQDIANWLVIGVVIAAVISVLIPDGFFTAYLGNSFISMLIVLAAAVPLYVCATGSVPIAAVLLMKGLSPGAVFVFLMAGPAVNAASMTIIGKILGRKVLIGYLSSIIGSALLFGFIINEFLPASWFTMTSHLHHAHEEMLPGWLGITSSIILGLLILNTYRMKYFSSNKTNPVKNINTDVSMEIKVIKVKGMTCNHCKATVENGIKGLPGIKNVDINLQQEQVTISAEQIDLVLVKSTVENLGYTFAGEV